MSIYLYSHTLKRDKEKDQIFPGNLSYRRAPEPAEKAGTRDSIST